MFGAGKMAGFLIRVHQIDTYINFISGRFYKTPGTRRDVRKNPEKQPWWRWGGLFWMRGGFCCKISGSDKKKGRRSPKYKRLFSHAGPFLRFFCFFVQDGRISCLGGGFKYFLFSPRTLRKWSNLTIICFKWVGSSTNEIIFARNQETALNMMDVLSVFFPSPEQFSGSNISKPKVTWFSTGPLKMTTDSKLSLGETRVSLIF